MIQWGHGPGTATVSSIKALLRFVLMLAEPVATFLDVECGQASWRL